MLGEEEIELLHGLQQEYSDLRAELKEIIARQITILSISATVICALLGVGINVAVGTERSNGMCTFWFYVLIPCATFFFGALWLDQTWRQKRMDKYLYEIEEYIHINFFQNVSAPYWEHYYNQEVQLKNWFLKPNRWYYYFTLMLFILLPIFSVSMGIGLNCRLYWWCIFTAFFGICFLYFVISYCISIIQMNV